MKTVKIPWCDMYIVKGSELRDDEKSEKITNRIMMNIMEENHYLKRRLVAANIGLVSKPERKRKL